MIGELVRLYECSDCGAVLAPGGRDIHKLWHAMIAAELKP